MVNKNTNEENQSKISKEVSSVEDDFLSKLKELESKIAHYDAKLKELDKKEAKLKFVPKTDKQKRNTSISKKLEIQCDKDREMVKGMFKFYEIPGGNLSFVYRKYKNDPIEKFSMQDGEIYTVPFGIAKHLNSSGWYPRHQYFSTEKGQKMRIGEKVHRYGFQSLDFVDLEERNPVKEIVTVENTF